MSLQLPALVLLAVLAGGRAVAQPGNDDHANPGVFSPGSNSVGGTIVGATREPGEGSRFGNSVWWRWTAPSNRGFTFLAESDQFRPFLSLHRPP